MDDEKKALHLFVGFLCGQEKTCGTKQKHHTQEAAQKAADSLNRSGKARNKTEPYPCFFCGQWHIGREMSYDELRKHIQKYSDLQ